MKSNKKHFASSPLNSVTQDNYHNGFTELKRLIYLSVQYLNMFLLTVIVTIFRNSFLFYVMREIQEDTIVLNPSF